jgi:RHS repeat-associated protein
MNLSIAHLLYANPSKDLSEKDYYPGGMVMPGRSFNTENYRFGFNGKESVNELNGTGNSIDFGDRINDLRLGRWMSPDKIIKAGLSPYMFGRNNSMNVVDMDGKDDIHFYYYATLNKSTGLAQTNAFVVIEKTNQTDRFYSHVTVNSINLDAKGDDQFTTTSNTTQFYPFESGSNSGLGSARIPFTPFSISTNDRAYLVEKAREFPQLADYVKSRYKYTSLTDKQGWSDLNKDLPVSNALHNTHKALEAVAGILMLAEGGVQLFSPSMKYSVAPSKFDYFLGRVGGDNLLRSQQNLKDLNSLGISSERQLMGVFDQAINVEGGVTTTTAYGTTISKSVQIGTKGEINVGFFYEGGNMSSTPRVSTIIPKIYKQ